MIDGDSDSLARAVAAKMYENDRASRLLGIEVLEVRAGFARARFRVRDDMVNGHGILHGGFVFTLADTAFAYACNSRNRSTVALQCSITFCAPGKTGGILEAVATERVLGGRTGTYDVEILDEAGISVALFRGISYGIAGTVV